VLLVSLVSLPVFLLPQPVNPWRAIAAADLEAARALLRDNHPGSVPALGDDGFRRALDDGQAQARARVEQISTYAGLEATLRAFALGLATGTSSSVRSSRAGLSSRPAGSDCNRCRMRPGWWSPQAS
jgi:hypothetical protein